MENPERIAKIAELKRQRSEDIDQRIARLTALEELGIDLHDLTDTSDTMLDPNDKRSGAVITLLEELLKVGRSDEVEYLVMTATRRVQLPGCTGFGAEPQYRTEARVIIIEGNPIIVSSRDNENKVTFTVKGSVATTAVSNKGIEELEGEILVAPLSFTSIEKGTAGLINYGKTMPSIRPCQSRRDAMSSAVDAYAYASSRWPIEDLHAWSGIPELQPPAQ